MNGFILFDIKMEDFYSIKWHNISISLLLLVVRTLNPKNVLSKDEVLKLITHFIISFEQLFQIQN